jgi:hypothetical protein
MRIPAAGEDQKFTVFGAVDYATGQVLWQTSARKGETAFTAFLEHLAEELPANEPAVLVLDNVGYHKSHVLRDVWRRYANRLEPFFLPAYAPQLNLCQLPGDRAQNLVGCRQYRTEDHRAVNRLRVVSSRLAVSSGLPHLLSPGELLGCGSFGPSGSASRPDAPSDPVRLRRAADRQTTPATLTALGC